MRNENQVGSDTMKTMPKAGIQAVLFDKDGALFDFAGTWLPAYEAIAAQLAHGDSGLAAELLQAAGRDKATGRIEPRSIVASGSNLELARLWSKMLRRRHVGVLERELDQFFCEHGLVSNKPVTDLPRLFERLRARGFKLGIATMDSHAAAEIALHTAGVGRLIDYFAGYDSGFGQKPGPGMVEGFCRAISLPASAVAVVGDTLDDVEMGRAAGAGLVVGVLSGVTPRDVLEADADRVIASIADLETLLDETLGVQVTSPVAGRQAPGGCAARPAVSPTH